MGSPPRMRGKRWLEMEKFKYNGITPAHAGKTPPAGAVLSDRQDHPRACGENV